MIRNAKCAIIVGKRGAGKSTLQNVIHQRCPRLIVTTTVPTDYLSGYIQCHNPDEVKKAMQENWKGDFKICFRIGSDWNDHIGPQADLHWLAGSLAKAQLPYVKNKSDKQIVLSVDEVTRCYTQHPPKDEKGDPMSNFKTTILEGRHYGINLLVATQRPTLIPTDFRDNVDDFFVLAVGGDNALENVCKYVGHSYKDKIRALPKYRYMHFKDGQLVGEYDTKTAPS